MKSKRNLSRCGYVTQYLGYLEDPPLDPFPPPSKKKKKKKKKTQKISFSYPNCCSCLLALRNARIALQRKCQVQISPCRFYIAIRRQPGTPKPVELAHQRQARHHSELLTVEPVMLALLRNALDLYSMRGCISSC